MFLKKILGFIMVALLAIGCSDQKKTAASKSEDGSYEVKISASAGDDYFEIINQDTFSFTPYPYNIGVIKTNNDVELSCLVISNRLSKNSRIKILPIGLLHYKEFDVEKRLIIGVPKDRDDRVIKADDLVDLVTKYPALKNIIQEWSLGKCGLGCTKFIAWDDGNAAELWIQRNLS